MTLWATVATAQVGEYRTDFALGLNGGYVMSNMAFVPKVPQTMLGGMTFGVTARYTCEKYFKSICPSQSLFYSRKMNYVQVPLLARLGWGRERNGFQAFIQLGPQFGFFMSDKADTNFDVHDPAFNPKIVDGKVSEDYQYAGVRSSHVVAQDTMAVENKLDYGIAVGAGLEFSNRHVGHFLIEGRYYYGLGNIYGSTKRDYFGRSNFGNIVVKFTYLFDIIRTKNSKIK